MPSTPEAFITPQLLTWARERAYLSPDDAARMFKVPREKWEAWESGDKRPTFRQAEDVANRLHVPFGYLFLSSRPEESIDLPDLRTVGNANVQDPSVDLIDVAEDAMRKQEWLREYRMAEGAEPLEFVGSYEITDDPRVVAEDIRQRIGLTPALRRAAKSWELFLGLLARQIESAGVVVLRTGIVGNNTRRKLNPREFRGFAISDAHAPVIFVNGSDARPAQAFTMAHELVHIWIDQSGVSNPDYRRTASQQPNAIERFCNRVAAEVLLPSAAFEAAWDQGADIATNLLSMRADFRVSELAALIHARDLGLVSQAEFEEHYERLDDEQKAREARSGDGGDFYPTVLARNSANLASAVLSALSEGELSVRDASDLLGVKPKNIDNVADYLVRAAHA